MDKWKESLKEWGLETYIPYFEEEGIDDQSWSLLDEATIEKIFPKIGPKLIFKKNYYKKPNDDNIVMIPVKVLAQNNASTPTHSAEQADENLIFTPDEELNESLRIMFGEDKGQSKENNKKILDLDVIEDLTQDVSNNSEADIPPSKKIKLDSVFPEGLEGSLKKYTDGHIVWMNKEKLSEEHRNKLVKVLINELFALYGNRLQEKIFLNVASEIAQLFPNELQETYFVGYKPNIQGKENEKKKGSNPKGKLWNRYVNVKAALKSSNNLKKTPGKPKLTPEKILENQESIKKDLKFLNLAMEPVDRIFEAWDNTYNVRRKSVANKELDDILKEFPCLTLNLGIELIEKDFEKKYPDLNEIIFSTFPKVSRAILKELGDRKIVIPSLQDYDENTRAILGLPYLFSAVSLKRSRKGLTWRPTRSEVAHSFCLNVDSIEELQQKFDERKEKLVTYNIPLMPFSAIVGKPAEKFYIIVNSDIRYEVANTIRMIDVLYKLFYAFNIPYPTEAEHVWSFIDEMIYHKKMTNQSPTASSVISDIKFHLQKEK